MELLDEYSVKSRFRCALQVLFERDRKLLDIRVNERSLTHRLALHLQGLFPDWDVD